MSFRFNFSTTGDSDSDNDTAPIPPPDSNPALAQTLPKHHSLESLINTLPPNISYTTLNPTSTVRIPRRELYDVRMQLMAEDKLSEDASSEKNALVGLGDEDIRTSFYEGGLKSWECSVDLVRYLAGEGLKVPGKVLEVPLTSVEDVVERILIDIEQLGCGTSLPSLYLFQTALEEALGKYHFTLADYNAEVLRLVTLPNLFLSWNMCRATTDWDAEGDLEVDESRVADFAADLERVGITVDFVSGGWGAGMLEVLKAPYDLVMGSETIYSPATTGLFTDVLLASLWRGGRGLVAAKQIYFGVGGSVGDFVGRVGERGGWGTRMVSEVRDVGVGRSIVQVQSSVG